MPGAPSHDVTKIGDLPALRALADPLRLRILDLLGAEPRSVKELAAALDMPRNKLHYHVNVLQKHGLVRVASTRIVGGALERCYEPTGRTFEARHLPIPPAVAGNIAGLLDTAARDIDARLRSGKRGPTAIGNRRIRLSETKHEELVHRLRALLDEYAGPDDPDDPDRASSRFVFALYEDEASE
jgi:DNA-binding transcriptional ArsR family regulator